MAFLVHNLPPVDVYVKKEYLYDLEYGHGELTPGLWISVKSVEGKALYFETLLTDYGALFDKLPLSAFVWKKDYNTEDQLPLDTLQIWDCFDYDITVIKKPMLCDCEFFGKDKKMHKGEYLFTIDNAHRDRNYLNQNLSEHDPEHKSFNVIKKLVFFIFRCNLFRYINRSLIHPIYIWFWISGDQFVSKIYSIKVLIKKYFKSFNI